MPVTLSQKDGYQSQGKTINTSIGGGTKIKDTITTSSQILSDRTLNLKKEINNLDDEIMQL